MNRVINHPDMVVEDMLRGIVAAHPGLSFCPHNPRVVRHGGAGAKGRVAIVTGGGSGHEPAFIGYVGRNMVDAVAVGEVFSSPTAKSFFDAFQAADGGAGIACLYGNYAGDNMNVKMAMKMAERADINVKTVVANDDAASARADEMGKRRGVAGEILMWKVGGAKAAQAASLDQVIAAAQKAIDNTRSIGIGLSACTIPAVGKANFVIKQGEMEVGIGHHGEPGVLVQSVVPARDMARLMLDKLLFDLPFARGDKVAVLISGLGATPLMEQYIFYADVADYLQEAGIEVRHSLVGNLFTSLEMMGITLTLMRLDDELDQCMAYPCESIGLTIGARP
ncbi:dihydroxyacetone kinase subunit DhaK [Herbaspirillum rhizosphaerae]|uniref:dihydroxyacetone kinase subunit DhaK n=1 Tax=Herbaspirillum rhizosphaerae TaxID=346179 RepID=UPI00067DDCDB|nr:dihydroxyacetone kinase subunit DhaK [Herbaspirillum rhizosphaerae]